ncbi:V-type proton ATPase subunit H-like isoform X2 [Oncorhynchus kisutch]|uniref:V-type proton ATPase subunit H-like isoform X2 n=1 Tax=Oncorhynchus kisutch TaxID=8019 RepID=UPI0012DF43AC|nr:V-type proton ATPase subunit H-like isoform X2 [Oncorhynchus kisutch]XP_031662596.1 V-type proton ATPase subunit H-like isoform X2 [Oncorhynchus kisutch]
MDIRGAVDAAVPTNIIAAKAAEVRANKVNWQSYLQGQMISAEDCEFIKKFEVAHSEEKQIILTNEGHQCAKTFLNLMAHISKEQTVQYILTLIDDTLQENHQRVNIFFDYSKKTKNTAWSYFLPMLNRQDLFTVHMAARIIAKLAAWGRDLMEGSDLNYYFNWIKTQLSSQSSQYVQCVAGCLQLMLRVNEYRFAWVEADGVNCITAVLSNKCGFQLQYQMGFCVWLLAFNSQLCEQLRRYNVVPALSDILQESVKEKVTRIILAAFRNLLEKSADRETRQEYALGMIQCKVLKQLENLDQQKYDDEDITEDIKFLLESLGESVQDLSSFDEYSSELKSGRLEWSPVHKSEKFWRENAVRLNEKNYELLKILTRLLEVSDDPQVIAVAAHDVGEYVRHYPRGKRVIEQLGGKQLVMNHMHHDDQLVRYNALLAVQKLMVHNWEYLGKQLQSSDQQQQPAVATRS